jgi:hypothetical protein
MKPAVLSCLLVLVFFLPPAGLAAETPPQQAGAEQPAASRPGSLLAQLRYDLLYVACAPARLGPLGWGVSAGVVGSIYWANERRHLIRDWWQGSVRTQATDEVSSVVRQLGSPLTPPVLAGAFLAGGLLAGRSRELETGLLLAESYAYTLALTSLGQFVLSEERPCNGGDAHYLNGEIGHGVSGHSAAAACLAGPLNRQYLQLKSSDSGLLRAAKLGGKLVVYGLPVLVGLSRVNGDSHFLWNVMAGWAIGYTMGELIPNAHEARRQGRSWWIGPAFDGRAVGVAFQMRN